jgi:hypothetical protein
LFLIVSFLEGAWRHQVGGDHLRGDHRPGVLASGSTAPCPLPRSPRPRVSPSSSDCEDSLRSLMCWAVGW